MRNDYERYSAVMVRWSSFEAEPEVIREDAFFSGSIFATAFPGPFGMVLSDEGGFPAITYRRVVEVIEDQVSVYMVRTDDARTRRWSIFGERFAPMDYLQYFLKDGSRFGSDYSSSFWLEPAAGGRKEFEGKSGQAFLFGDGRYGVSSLGGITQITDASGVWRASPSLKGVGAVARNKIGVATTAQSWYIGETGVRLWYDGKTHPLEGHCKAYDDGGYTEPFVKGYNSAGMLLLQARPPGQEEGVPLLLMPVEVAPEVLAVNSDFDEGRINPVTGFAIPDCDDVKDVDVKTGAGNTLIGLNAVRDHLENGAIKAHKLTTEDLHQGWFGVGVLPKN